MRRMDRIKLKLKEFYQVLYLSMIMFLMVIGVLSFCAGYKNVDMAQNIRWINAEYDLDLGDTGLSMISGEAVPGTADYWYRVGTYQLYMSLIILIGTIVSLIASLLGFMLRKQT